MENIFSNSCILATYFNMDNCHRNKPCMWEYWATEKSEQKRKENKTSKLEYPSTTVDEDKIRKRICIDMAN